MKACLAIAILAAATPAAAEFSGRGRLGETWVWPVTFQQALAPLAPLARDAVTSGQCPGLKVGEGNVVHTYEFDAKMKTRGSGENKRWVVEELKLVNPSACEALDTLAAGSGFSRAEPEGQAQIAALSASVRSVFSQLNPPSASGVRPKWP
jgi:hypothetical protein